jgi:hypothetical protein
VYDSLAVFAILSTADFVGSGRRPSAAAVGNLAKHLAGSGDPVPAIDDAPSDRSRVVHHRRARNLPALPCTARIVGVKPANACCASGTMSIGCGPRLRGHAAWAHSAMGDPSRAALRVADILRIGGILRCRVEHSIACELRDELRSPQRFSIAARSDCLDGSPLTDNLTS